MPPHAQVKAAKSHRRRTLLEAALAALRHYARRRAAQAAASAMACAHRHAAVRVAVLGVWQAAVRPPHRRTADETRALLAWRAGRIRLAWRAWRWAIGKPLEFGP
jgi:hypothetical protein